MRIDAWIIAVVGEHVFGLGIEEPDVENWIHYSIDNGDSRPNLKVCIARGSGGPRSRPHRPCQPPQDGAPGNTPANVDEGGLIPLKTGPMRPVPFWSGLDETWIRISRSIIH